MCGIFNFATDQLDVNRDRIPLSNARVNTDGEALVECGVLSGSNHIFVHDVNTADMPTKEADGIGFHYTFMLYSLLPCL